MGKPRATIGKGGPVEAEAAAIGVSIDQALKKARSDRDLKPIVENGYAKVKRRSTALPQSLDKSINPEYVSIDDNISDADIEATILKVSNELGIKLDWSRVAKIAANHVSIGDGALHEGMGPAAQSVKSARRGKRAVETPQLPENMAWPTDDEYREAKASGVDILDFLRERWGPLIKAGYGELRFARRASPAFVRALENYEKLAGERNGKPIPQRLRFLTESQVTTIKVQGGLRALRRVPTAKPSPPKI